MKKMVLLFLCFFFFISCSNRNLLELTGTVEEIKVRGFYESNNVGKKGTLILSTEWFPILNIVNTKKETFFEATISNSEQKSFKLPCGIWKEDEDSYLLIFCNVNEEIPKGEWSLKLNQVSFDYKNYSITLVAESDFNFTKKDEEILDLYSDKQTINLDDGNESYDLKFKIVSYNNNKIGLNWIKILDDCKQVNDELICTLTKKKIEEITTVLQGKAYFQVIYINEEYRVRKFPLIPKIDIIYKNIQKKNINILITNLIEKVTEHDTCIAYETDVTDIDNVYMDLESFELPFENGENEENFSCTLRKYDENPLLLVCFANRRGGYWLKEITQEIPLDTTLNIKYNFIIKPVKILDKLELDRDRAGSFIMMLTPEVLDFTEKDSLTIEYYIENPDSLTGITFNENEDDLVCETVGKGAKRCTVPKSHFKGKNNGYYFTKHQNHLSGKSFSYEAPPIKVILSNSSSNSKFISFYLTSLLLFLYLL